MSIKAEPSFSLADQLFNAQSVGKLSAGLASADPHFSRRQFEREVLAPFPELTLKQRIDWIVTVLEKYLPGEFTRCEGLLRRALPPPLDPDKNDDDFGEFIWVVPGEYVARHGCRDDRLELALNFLREATKRFSSESAIRPFLQAFPRQSLQFMRDCASDDNYHVRRFASEGIRPFLPWAQRVQLPPQAVLDILDLLHADTTRYVTRSVANAMNDLTKIDAELAVGALAEWRRQKLQQPRELEWMTRHALRSLMKQGHPEALRLLGYPRRPRIEISEPELDSQVRVGETLQWQCRLKSLAKQKLKITLHIHFLKANGKHSPKAFIVADAGFDQGQETDICKRHHFKPITTRSLYPGRHFAELVINGVSVARKSFELVA